MNNFSPNMLKNFDQCQQKFCFKYVEKISMPQKPEIFEKGKKIHALANYFLNKNDISKMEQTLTQAEKTDWEALKSNKYMSFEPVVTEHNLSCKIGDFWVGGRLDAIVKQGNDYFILDYKTGNIPQNPQNDFQTMVYLLAADKIFKQKNIPVNSITFVYIGLKQGEEKSILFKEDLKKTYEENLKEICKKIDFTCEANVFSKTLTACKYCEYNKICYKD
ncbi:MAG TPA: PD-(D/E)XK nuclease family protein, partial [Candidatus Gastranaerophilaceae bacterium]|nr:PD-(D/E)XK nuclease family protein [Candidatus Gastranaerophilaceae bacterium]